MYRIAVVDTDRTLLALVNELFADRGWSAVCHTTAQLAADTLRQEKPDLILLDVWLDQPTSGWDILQELKTDPATQAIPVIVWSGATDYLGGKETWLAEHGISILAKPFDIDDLYSAVESALHRRLPDAWPN